MYTITAILWSYANGQLSSSEQTLFSINTQDTRPVAAANGSFEISEGGSIQFTLAYTHPLYDSLVPLETYVRVTDDTQEIFYGRILTKSDPTFSGQITYAAEGALSFLHDGEVPPEARDSKGQLVTRTLTAEEFFRWCIGQHNTTVADPRRQFIVGQIAIDKKSETRQYQVSSYTDTRNAIDQYLRGVYGGYLRARSDGNGGQYIDWLKQYDRLDPQDIEIGTNVRELTNTTSADGVYTVLRPVGQNGLLLDSPEIDLFPAAKMALMGRIVKTVSFNEADTKEKLQKLATDYADRMESVILGETSIRLIDMHYLDGTIPKIRIGDRFDHIHGNIGTEFTVAHMDVDFLHAENDTFSFKNRKDLEGDLNGGLSGGTLSKATSRGAKSAGFGLRYYHESSDKALLQTKEVEIIAEDLRIVGHDTTVIAENYERMSRTLEVEDGIEIGDWPLWQPNTEYPEGAKVSHIENHVRYGYVCLETHTSEAEWNETEASKWQRRESTKESVRYLYGTEVIQNSSQIASVAGEFEILTDFYDDWPRWEPGKLYHVGDKVSKDVEGRTFGYICTQQHTSTSWEADVSRYWLEQTGRKSVRLLNGSAFTIDDQNGGMMTVGQRIQDLDVFNEQFTGSALWTQRDNITGVTGQFQIVTDPLTGEKHINILAGGGMRIKHDNVEYGLYHSGNVTGGMIVDLVNTNADPPNWISGRHYNVGDVVKYGNDQYICVKETYDSQFLPAEWRRFTNTKIIGDRVDITAAQVRVGDTSNVAAWMTETGQDIDDLEGLVADKATIADLNAAKARISTLETDYLRTSALSSAISLLNTVNIQNTLQVNSNANMLFIGSGTGENYSLNTGVLKNMIKTASVANNVLTLTPFYGDPITFSKATTLTGAWSSGVYTVTASPQGNTRKVGFAQNADSPLTLATNGTPTSVSSNRKLVSAPLRIIETIGTTQTDVYTTSLSINATAAWNYGYDQAAAYTIMPGAGTGTSFVVKAPNSARTGSDDKTFSITKGATPSTSGYAAVSLSGTVVGRIDIGDWYTAGQNDVTITKGAWSSGKIDFTKSAGTASTKSVQLTAAAATWSGNTASVVIWDGTAADAQHGVSTGYTVTVNASGRYTAGQNDVAINKGAWSSGQVQFTKSAGTASTKGVRVGLSGSWSNGVYSYTINDYYDNSQGSSTGYSSTINAPGVSLAFDCTDLVNPTYDEGDKNDNAITASASHGTAPLGSGVQVVHMTTGSWSSGHIAVNCRLNDDNGKLLNRIWLTIPNSSNYSTGYTGSVSGRYNVGSFRKSTISANTYIIFNVGGRGFYITVNA